MQPQAGLFWHKHPVILLGWCHSYDEGAAFIRTNKDESEQELRLRFFQPVRGILPQEVVDALQSHDQTDQALNQASQAFVQAAKTLNQAWQAWQTHIQTEQDDSQAWQAYIQASQAFVQAAKTLNQASLVYDQTWQACIPALLNNREVIKALHKAECPDCPWNGETIFP